METRKIERYFNLITNIRYHNDNGPKYAYMQFLAYSRELIDALRPLKNTEQHCDSIERSCWLLNEYLGSRFTPRHESILVTQILEAGEIFRELSFIITRAEKMNKVQRTVHHQQAA
jgi:hypothetical protein